MASLGIAAAVSGAGSALAPPASPSASLGFEYRASTACPDCEQWIEQVSHGVRAIPLTPEP